MPWLLNLSPSALIIAFLLATNIVAVGAWRLTAHSLDEAEQKVATCKAQHEAFVAQVQVQGEAAQKKLKATEAEQRRISDETTKGWAAALDVVRADYARRLRGAAYAGSGGGQMPGISAAATGTDDKAVNALPPPERVAADCAEETLKLVYLQKWVDEQHNANTQEE